MLKLVDIAESKQKEKTTQKYIEDSLDELARDFMYKTIGLEVHDNKHYAFYETNEHKQVSYNNDKTPQDTNKYAIIAEIKDENFAVRFAKYNGKRITEYASEDNHAYLTEWLNNNPEWTKSYTIPEVMMHSGYNGGFDEMFRGYTLKFIPYVIRRLNLTADTFLDFIEENSEITDDMYDVFDYEMTSEFGRGAKASFTVFAKDKNIKTRINRLEQALDTIETVNYSNGWWQQLLYTGGILRDLDFPTVLRVADSFGRYPTELAKLISYNYEEREQIKKVFKHIEKQAIKELAKRVKDLDTPIPTGQLDMINDIFEANNIKKTKQPMVINHIPLLRH